MRSIQIAHAGVQAGMATSAIGVHVPAQFVPLIEANPMNPPLGASVLKVASMAATTSLANALSGLKEVTSGATTVICIWPV